MWQRIQQKYIQRSFFHWNAPDRSQSRQSGLIKIFHDWKSQWINQFFSHHQTLNFAWDLSFAICIRRCASWHFNSNNHESQMNTQQQQLNKTQNHEFFRNFESPIPTSSPKNDTCVGLDWCKEIGKAVFRKILIFIYCNYNNSYKN